MKLTKFLPC